MANTTIQINLQNANLVNGLPSYEPGERVQGTVQIFLQNELKCNHVWVRLGWHTEGRGDISYKDIERIKITQGVLSPLTPIYSSFNFQLPQDPWSYAGHYINIIWDIKVTIDIPLAVDINHSQPFVVTPKR